ncbi:MAG: ABC transporter [Verrucomicrobia bacterium RIFCSPLOWO2_12_FULL_64_8]|nr:MAG: ABC transporter [Verrucomicrobia bacterium RIFCSPLOWO2_12_FULL_64_8]
MNETSPVLEFLAVSKSYEAPAGVETVQVLRKISLAVGRGEAIGILGPSGSGKSTLLNLAGTLDCPTDGVVRLEGQDLSHLSDSELSSLRCHKIGFIFQSHHLLPQCTALENVLLPTMASGSRRVSREDVERGRRLLERVGLGDRLHHLPGQLSGGERQRVAFVRALINRPVIILADEPTGALDPDHALLLMNLLLELNREENVTLLVVTHAVNLTARLDRIFTLREGKLEEMVRES